MGSAFDPQQGASPVDLSGPSAARAYDYFLGGASNFAVDREFAEQVIQTAPSIPAVTLLNRSFLRRVVRYFLDQGIRQFLDLGSGIPTVGNTHQIAEHADAASRTVYVDWEPVAYQHATIMLEGDANATVLQTDMRDVDAVLEHPETRRLIDFTRPVGLLVVGVLLYLSDADDPAGMLAAYRRRLAPGSLLAVSTLTDEHAGPELYAEMQRLQAAYAAAGEPVYPRNHAQISTWFADMPLVPPGLVMLPDWHPDEAGDTGDGDSLARPLGYGAVARIT